MLAVFKFSWWSVGLISNLITANQKYQAHAWQSGRLQKYSSSSVLIPPCGSRNLVAGRCRSTDWGAEWENLYENHRFSISILPREERIWGKGFHSVTWQSISFDAWQAAAESNHQCHGEDLFHAIEQEKKWFALAKSQNPYLNQEHDLHLVELAKHKFSASQDYISAGAMGQHVTRWQQVFWIFFSVQESQKRAAEPRLWSDAPAQTQPGRAFQSLLLSLWAVSCLL